MIDRLEQERRDKMAAIRAAGVDPYGHRFERTDPLRALHDAAAAAVEAAQAKLSAIQNSGTEQEIAAARANLRNAALGKKVQAAAKEPVAEKKTGKEWAQQLGVEVLDPDGWAQNGVRGVGFDTEKIPEEEFLRRAALSTLGEGASKVSPKKDLTAEPPVPTTASEVSREEIGEGLPNQVAADSLAFTNAAGEQVVNEKAVKADWDAGMPYLQGKSKLKGSQQNINVPPSMITGN